MFAFARAELQLLHSSDHIRSGAHAKLILEAELGNEFHSFPSMIYS